VLIDCDKCVMRDIACADCVVGALMAGQGRPETGSPGERAGSDTVHGHGTPGTEIGEPERQALGTLADAGLVPPLRLVLPAAGPDEPAGEFPGSRFPDAEAS
jgi:hypothetical protein